MEQFEQLLTCAICLDRYRNPKLLPCQHSFCMEPCMDGLVDYVRRQVKCPECRAEHRIPYQGVQGYPTNVTLQRFLELHIEITGELPDPTSGQTMKRCGVCSEKAYCTLCLHCDKEICPECKGAHKDILRREITRITNQIRRALHRLEDILAYVEKSMLLLQQNSTSVSEEVEEIYSRLSKALKDRAEYLRNEIDRYLTTEHKNLASLKENLETEISNIQSNCDLADKYMQTEAVDWDDCELIDAKEIFLKTVEFLRYFETETGDYTRRARFIMAHDPNQLVKHVANFGDLAINIPHQPFTGGNALPSAGNTLQPPVPGLMRSKSDHRLASQFRQQEEHGYDGNENCGRVSPLGGRKFGERQPMRSATSDRLDSRYGRNDRSDYGGDNDSGYDNEGNRFTRSRFRARLAARHANENADSDTDMQNSRSVRFADTHAQHPREREKERVLDTEDVARGPLSGITRLYDSPRVMQRLLESETKKLKKEESALVQAQQPMQTPKVQPQQQRRTSNTNLVQRQVSEDDEISRIKRQNKNTASTSEAAAEPHRTTVPERVNSLRREELREERQMASPNRSSIGSDRNRKTPVREATISSNEESNEDDKDEQEVVSALQTQRRSSKTPVNTNSRRSSASSDIVNQSGVILKKSARSASSDSTASSESSGSSSAVRSTGAAFTTDELRQQYMNRASRESNSKGSDSGHSSPRAKTVAADVAKKESPVASSRFQSRFLTGGNKTSSQSSTITEKPKTEHVLQNDEDEEETESSTESEETESEEEPTKPDTKAALEKTDIGPLLARSANARDKGGTGSTGPNTSYRRSSRDDGSSSSSRFNTNPEPYRSSYASPKEASTNSRSSKYMNRNRNDEPEPKARFTSRFLNKSKSTGLAPADEEDFVPVSSGRRYSGNDDSFYTSRRDPGYSALKERKTRLARSKSTHGFGEDADIELDDSTPLSYYPASYLASKTSNSGNDLSRSRSSHVLKSRENSPERPLSNAGPEKDGSSLSSWARYLKNKYGNRAKDPKDTNLSTPGSSGTSSTSRRLSLGLPFRPNNSTSVESSDDDQKNLEGSPNSPIAATAVPTAGFAEVGTTLRSQYMLKRQLRFKIGSRGSGPGYFTWPRGIAVGPDNSIVVADSSNHRVQVFDQNGKFIKEFGTFGNGEGEFDCLAGIAVNRIGQYIIADRYNHRIQVLDPSGRFLRAFGSQGSADGRFNYPWGITTDALGFIYVCDKENHRIQVFQSDGTFVGKFGSFGNKIGQLEHPHYITVSNTNRVIVSDSNNHRVQIFDVNGKVLNSIACEGSANGQFKFPRGVAVDDQGYILVGDSGNNRIQIFHPDGTFLRSFGCWGSGDGEFKGLEGVAVMSNGNILVCDRENHRVQVF